MFKVEEQKVIQENQMFSRLKPEFTGELMIDNPIHVKEIPQLEMISTGMDHLVALDKTG